MDPAIETSLTELHIAIDALDRRRVDELCVRLISQLHRSAALLSDEHAKATLHALRRKRFFNHMQRFADALIQNGHTAAFVSRQYAQSLIDSGALTAADAVLRGLLDNSDGRTETRGLLGRVHKQRYVDAAPCRLGSGRHEPARHASAMREAIGWYHDAYIESPHDNYWHGINAVACACRARRDGIGDVAALDPAEIASAVLSEIKRKGRNVSAWEDATALEACVALGDDDGAIGRAVRYTQHAEADAFEIASTIRQLEEVWCLDATTGVGEVILPLLKGALLQRETGSIEVTPAQARHAAQTARTGSDDDIRTLEKVFGVDAFTSYETYVTGVKRARIVARIGREPGGRGYGTGFLVRGRDLADRFKKETWLLLTNAHVISADYAYALAPVDAIVTFQAHPPDPKLNVRSYKVQAVLAESSPMELDFAVIKLKGRVHDISKEDHFEIAEHLPDNNGKARVYIVGHPGGGSLSYSLQDNLLLDYADPRLHYRTPTEGGSSGSPVYNDRWQLIGLHHAGSRELPRLRGEAGTYEANEGIWIQAIQRALA